MGVTGLVSWSNSVMLSEILCQDVIKTRERCGALLHWGLPDIAGLLMGLCAASRVTLHESLSVINFFETQASGPGETTQGGQDTRNKRVGK